MRIESQSADVVGKQTQRVEPAKAVQNVFAEVLAQVGRDGYASAQPVENGAPLTDRITETWNHWSQTTGRARFDDRPDAQQLQQDFGQLLLEAHNSGGYAAPQAFLKSLSKDQLATLQHTHRLVSPIRVDELTEEGSLNLLLPPPTQVDLNNDGLTQSGIGYTIRFPDSRTPGSVVEAWEKATADLPPGELAVRQLQMKADVLLANIHTDASGRFSHRVEPGDPDFVNPMASPGYSYVQKTQQRIDAVEYFKHQTPPEQYERDRGFWTELKAQLLPHDAP